MKLHNLLKKEKKPVCSAVIVAAGSSQRMGTDKIMTEIGGIPVLLRTLRAFENSEFVDEIVVVARMPLLQEIADMCKLNSISKLSQVVAGGATRMESALAGVSAVKKNASLVAVHDGARPFVSAELIESLVVCAAKNIAAVPVIKSTDTLKLVDDKGVVQGTVDRETTLRVQTPQVFSADILKGALTNAVNKELFLTDDAAAVEAMGVKAFAVEGDEDNIKLTTPRDLLLAELILKSKGEA